MAEIPERIGPYRVLSVVGEGGMGVVYKAEDQRLERVVALKVIRELEGDASRRNRFWQEARAAAQVAHPNACRNGGFFCHSAMLRDPWLDSLRTRTEFKALLNKAQQLHREASAAFVAGGGASLLGIHSEGY
jgi:serine/threonine protein kinase